MRASSVSSRSPGRSSGALPTKPLIPHTPVVPALMMRNEDGGGVVSRGSRTPKTDSARGDELVS